MSRALPSLVRSLTSQCLGSKARQQALGEREPWPLLVSTLTQHESTVDRKTAIMPTTITACRLNQSISWPMHTATRNWERKKAISIMETALPLVSLLWGHGFLRRIPLSWEGGWREEGWRCP